MTNELFEPTMPSKLAAVSSIAPDPARAKLITHATAASARSILPGGVVRNALAHPLRYT